MLIKLLFILLQPMNYSSSSPGKYGVSCCLYERLTNFFKLLINIIIMYMQYTLSFIHLPYSCPSTIRHFKIRRATRKRNSGNKPSVQRHESL